MFKSDEIRRNPPKSVKISEILLLSDVHCTPGYIHCVLYKRVYHEYDNKEIIITNIRRVIEDVPRGSTPEWGGASCVIEDVPRGSTPEWGGASCY